MKTKFFLLIALFLGMSAYTFAQSQTAAPTEKKDAPAVVTTPDQAKTGECAGHATMGAKAECKWVDANGDGKCDTCNKTEKECKEACKHEPAATTPKSGCAATCPHAKDCGKSTGTAPSKDGQK
jgi:hypothetical protein